MALSSNVRAGRAYVEIVADSSKLQRGLTDAREKLRAFGAAASGLGKDMLSLAGAMSIPLAFATKSFAGFDDSMRLVQAVTQATGRDFEELTVKAQTLGRETSYTAQQAADAMVALGRMGFSPREIDASIAAVLDLARSTGTDLSEAADFAANSLRIFTLRSEEMTRVADVLTSTANGSAQTLFDLFEALKIAGPQAKAANESIEDTCAALGVLANMGIKGSLAGTALRKSFSQFAKSDVQATLSEWGVATTDAEGNLRSLAVVMADVAKVMAQLPTAKRITFAEEIFDLRGSLAGLTLTGNIKQLDTFLDRLKDVEGVSAKTAKQMDAGLGGSFRLLESAAEGAMNALAGSMVATVQPMVDGVSDAINATTKWIEANKGLVTSIAMTVAGTAGFGAALIAIGVASRGIASGIVVVQGTLRAVSGTFALLSSAAAPVAASFRLMRDAFANYYNAAQPAIVSTSRLLAALRLPIDTRAHQIAAGLILMNRAETAAAAKSVLAAKWTAMVGTLKKLRTATIASAMAIRTHAAADALAASGAKALAAARVIAATVTSVFTAATAKATLAAAANTGATVALAATTKLLAAGYLAASKAAALFCAIPIGAIVVGLVAAFAGLYMWLARSGKYTAKLSERMGKLREEGDKQRQSDDVRMQRLQQLARKQKLSNAEMDEANRLTKVLQGRYGNLGISINATAKSLTIAADAQDRLNEAMKKLALQQVQDEIYELQANMRKLDRENEALQHWSHYNLWSKMSGGMQEALDKMESNVDQQQVLMGKIATLRQRAKAIMDGDKQAVSGKDKDTDDSLDSNIANEEIKQAQSKDDAANAAKRAADIEKQLRRESQTELENEIEDIQALKKEYIALIQTMLDYERSQKKVDTKKVAELEGKLKQAEQDADARVAKARQRDKNRKAEGVKEVKDDYRMTLMQTDRSREESDIDTKLEELQKANPQMGISVLEDLVKTAVQAVEEAKTAYEKVVDEVSSDGQVTDEEHDRVSAAQEKFTRLEGTREKYEGKLRSARDATEKAEDKQSPALGSFYAKALKGLGASTLADKTLKANQETAKNTKKTADRLRDMAKNGLVFS